MDVSYKIKYFVYGFGAALGIVFALNWWIHSSSTPRAEMSFDTTAVITKFVDLKVKPDGNTFLVHFEYDFFNNSDYDWITDPAKSTIFKVIKDNSILISDRTLEFNELVSIPAHEGVRISIKFRWATPSGWDIFDRLDSVRLRSTVIVNLNEFSHFEIFDFENRYKIRLPKPS